MANCIYLVSYISKAITGLCMAMTKCSYKEEIDFASSVIGLISSIISFCILFVGAMIINELRLRGVDAICGFHARLKANLKKLKKTASLSDGVDFSAEKSVFLYFSQQYIREMLEKRNSSYFVGDKDRLFIPLIESTIELFTKSDGQVPLSKKMYLYESRVELN